MVGALVLHRQIKEGEDPVLLARVVGHDASVLQSSDVTDTDVFIYEFGDDTAKYSVTGINNDSGQPSGSAGSTSGSVIFDTLQTDGRWKADTIGYNASYGLRAIDLAQTNSFSLEGGKTYRVEWYFNTISWGVIPLLYEYEILATFRK